MGESEIRPESVLFVFARPSDAIRLAGGTIAMTSDSGAPVTVVTALPDAQTDRADAALRLIGVSDHRILGSVGARMGGAAERRYEPGGSAGALHSADPGEVAADIATVIASIAASAVIGDSVDAADPDGAILARAARHAAAVMDAEFSSVVVERPTSRDDGLIDVDTSGVLQRKRNAIAALGGDAASVVPLESFSTETRFPSDAEERPVTWAEFGLGTRIVSVVIALLLGAVVGALGTVVFQSTLTIGEVQLPVGLIGCLFVIAAILIGLRLVFETRIIAAAAAIGVLGTIGLFSLESPGGSVLIPQADLSYFWIYGPVVIAFVVLAWPDLSRLRRVRIADGPASKGSTAP